MRAIDTNVVLRILLRDDPEQVERVDALVASGNLFIPLTVLSETEWVLRAVYGFDRPAIAGLFGSLTAIEGIIMTDRSALRWAIDRYSKGADFTDMIHLIASDGHPFLTFDRQLVKRAGTNSPSPAQIVR